MSYVVNNKEFGSIEQFVLQGRGCATTTPNHYQISRNDERIIALGHCLSRANSLVIPIRFIHITDEQRGHISEQQRNEQVEVLNAAYEKYGIEFNYDSETVEVVDNPQWFRMDHGSWEEREVKRILGGDPHVVLNFYTAGLSNGLLGWATFPWELDGDVERDGVVMHAGTLPGGDVADFNLGKTAVHEVGHWLGLWHTFQGGCDAYGDHVGDTPAHAAPNYGKPVPGRHNACPNSTDNAPIHNFMNYVDDEWMTEFTSGQVGRIWAQIELYRSSLIDYETQLD